MPPLIILSERRQRPPIAPHRQRLFDLTDAKQGRLVELLGQLVEPPVELLDGLKPADTDDAQRRIRAHFASLPVQLAAALAPELGGELSRWYTARIGVPILGAAQFSADPTPAQEAQITNLVAQIATVLNIDETAARAIVDRALRKGGIELLGAAKEKIVEAVLGVFNEAQAAGMTLPEFRRASQDLLKSLTKSNLEAEFRTEIGRRFGERNRQHAREAGAAVPFLQVLGVTDDRQRVTHRAVHGFIGTPDDPFFDEWRIPFGFNCRCKISSIPYLEAIRRGWAEYGPGGRGLVILVRRPAGDPPTHVYDPKKRKMVAVRPDDGFEGMAVGRRAA